MAAPVSLARRAGCSPISASPISRLRRSPRGRNETPAVSASSCPTGRRSALGARDPLLYFLQRLRDEAHRFAIGTHRAKRAKARVRSALDEIPGVGPRRKKALLHRFGSARGVSQAGLADLETVDGISSAVARAIHDHFRARSLTAPRPGSL